jgi:hypothetical protein
MINQRRPNDREIETALAEAERRGFRGRFPQLLLGGRIWLPFSRNLMIEEPDWDGRAERYGSVPRLVDELTAIRAGITDADPSVEHRPTRGTRVQSCSRLAGVIDNLALGDHRVREAPPAVDDRLRCHKSCAVYDRLRAGVSRARTSAHGRSRPQYGKRDSANIQAKL